MGLVRMKNNENNFFFGAGKREAMTVVYDTVRCIVLHGVLFARVIIYKLTSLPKEAGMGNSNTVNKVDDCTGAEYFETMLKVAGVTKPLAVKSCKESNEAVMDVVSYSHAYLTRNINTDILH